MNINKGLSTSWKQVKKIDWTLLAFLLLFLNVKLVFKLAAILLIYILRADTRFGFRARDSRLSWFYVVVPAIGMLNWLMSGMLSDVNYDLVVVTGILFWGCSILAMHQVKLSVEKNDPETIHRTIFVFLILNAVISLSVYLGIIIETGHLNPYRYQGNYQKYFIGTGDYIKGITFDTSTTNGVLNAFGVIYFLQRGKNLAVLLCMLVLLLTGSNITNLVLCITLLFIFIFQSSPDQKSIIIVCFIMLVIFLVKVSPQNNDYVTRAWKRMMNEKEVITVPAVNIPRITERPDSSLTADEKKEKTAQLYLDSMNRALIIKEKGVTANAGNAVPVVNAVEKPMIPRDSIHTPKFQHRKDTTAIEKDLISFIRLRHDDVPLSSGKKMKTGIPGKLIALEQTIGYFQKHPLKIIAGAGIGNFSSKLAFRATAMKISGGYPATYRYISKDFQSNHLDLYLYYFTNKDDLHSIANSPNSVYDQLLSEYGIAGLAAFAVFYVGYFIKRIKKNSYALPMLLFISGIFFIEYWFEQLSVVVFFELLMFLNIKETNTQSGHEST